MSEIPEPVQPEVPPTSRVALRLLMSAIALTAGIVAVVVAIELVRTVL